MLINRMREKKEIRQIKQQKVITKHTLELRQQYQDILSKNRQLQKEGCMTGAKISKQNPIKREQRKQTIDSTDRYEKEIVQKIHTQHNGYRNNPNMFQIKIKEIRPKPKSNIRLQTENGNQPVSATTTTEKIKNSNSQVGTFCVNKNCVLAHFIAKREVLGQSVHGKRKISRTFIFNRKNTF